MPERPILLVGATGFLGRALLPVLARHQAVTAARFRSPEFDAPVQWVRLEADPETLKADVRAISPSAIVNAAALASLAACAAHPDLAYRLNAELPGALAEVACETGARFLHLSTDQVFDGAKGNYREVDDPAPFSAYGRSKLDGERGVLRACPQAAILRVNLVCGRSRGPARSSVDEILARAAAGQEVLLFTDEFRSPVAVSDVAAAVKDLLPTEFRGLLHLGGPRLSRYELGRALLELHGHGGLARPASLADYDGPPRARDTSFDSTRAGEILSSPPGGLARILEDCR